MASALNTKINSYTLDLGIELSEAYAIPPTITGTYAPANGYNSNTAWTFSGVNAPTYEATVGPAGGAGSWRFKSGPTSGDCRVRSTASSIMQRINDRDFSVGMWVKINTAVPANSSLPVQTFQPSTTAGYLMVVTANSSGVMRFECLGNQTITGTGTVSTGVWYYLATVRTQYSTTFYVNGVSQGSYSFSGVSTNGTNMNFGQINQGYEADTNICNWYLTSTSAIGATEIAAIYDAGAFDKVVKYYDGSAWQTASGQKVYNGTSWMNLTNANTKKWDGSAWVEL